MLRRLADIRRGELGRTALAFTVLLLVVGSYTVVKAVRDAVFLSRFSVTELSLVSIGLAVLSGIVVSTYLRTTADVARNWLMAGTHWFVALTLILIGIGLRAGGASWLSWVLYAWSSIFGVFAVAQFWLLAGDLFDVREAKRLFGLVGWGGVAGGLVGGAAAGLLATPLGVPGLLWLAAAMLVAASFATRALWRMRRSDIRAVARSPKPSPAISSLLLRPSYLRLLAGGLIVATVVTTLLDWQLKAVAKSAYEGRADALAAFFGSIHAYVSAASFGLQALIASWLFPRYGVGVGRAILPGVLVVGFGAIAGHALLGVSLLAVLTGVRLAEGGARFAINQPAAELSWLPIPIGARDASKPLVDTVGDRIGTGLAGLIWIALAALSLDRPDRVHWIALAGIVLVAGWLLLLGRTHRAYIDEIRSALNQRSIDLESLRRSLGDEQTRQTIIDSLESGDIGRIRFALYLLESWDQELPDLATALGHPRPDIRIQALTLLAKKQCAEQRSLAVANLAHDDVEVREAAVAYLRATAPIGTDPVVEGLRAPDSEVRLVRWLIAAPDPVTAQATAAAAAREIASAGPVARLAMIRLLGAAPGDSVAPLLLPLLDDPDEQVVEAAIRAAGRAKAAPLVRALAAKLGQRRWRATAMSALADVGAGALSELMSLLRDPATGSDEKRAIVRLAGASAGAERAPELAVLLDGDDRDLSAEALRALARIRAREPIAVDARKIRARVCAEATGLVRDLAFLEDGAWPSARAPVPDDDFLRRSVRDAVNARVDRVFRLLSLIHEPSDVQSAQRALRSPVKARRASGVELLDNLVGPEIKRALLPALEDADSEQFAALARSIIGTGREPRDAAIARLRSGDDPWLRQVGEWAAGCYKENRMGRSLVEKALELGTVDVLARVSSEDLAHIAQIAEEIDLPAGVPIYALGDAPDALYVVLSGSVRLYQDKEEIGVLGAGEAFGSWALFDEGRRVASAIPEGDVTVLKVDREEFLDLLGDRVAIARAIFKAMVERIRSLAELVNTPG